MQSKLSRFTAKGVDEKDKQVLLAYELNEDAFKVDLYIIPSKLLSKEQIEFLEKDWIGGEAFEFPEETIKVNPNLNADSILPDNIRSEETGKIRATGNEWAYNLLTAKLWESYLIELDELKKKSAELTHYDRQLFDDAKSFWERVLEHRKERDISQERLDKIKEDVNSIFEKLKTFRKTESAEFESASAKLRDDILASLEDLKKRMDEKANFKALADELKNLQHDTRKNRYSKADDVLVRKGFDSAYQYLSEQRNNFFSDKNAGRIKGLNEVIQKMEVSLKRDKYELEKLTARSGSNKASSIELQLAKLKINMLNETVVSKEEKLKDIRSTLESLQRQSNKSVLKKDAKSDEVSVDTSAEASTENEEAIPSSGE
jgi:transposase